MLFLAACSVAGAAQYWVATNGDNSHPGTRALPWLTVGHAVSLAQTNDFVWVEPGTYAEYPAPANSGSQGTNITYKGVGYPTIYGFNMSGLCNWRIIGFHISYPKTNAGYPHININVNHCTNAQILDNFFDNTYKGIPISISYSSSPWFSYSLIRSNRFFRAGLIPNTVGVPYVNMIISGTNNLIEYNDASQSDDFINLWGSHNVLRNNYYHDISWSYFTTEPHTDGMQTWGQPGIYPNFSSNLIDHQMIISNSDPHGHCYILRNASPASTFLLTDLTVRRSVGLYIGGMIGINSDTPNIRDYNNTWATIGGVVNNAKQNPFAISVDMLGGSVVPTNFVVMNDIFSYASIPSYGYVLYNFTNGGSWGTKASHNLTYRSGPKIKGDSGGSLTNVNPRHVNTMIFDYHLTNTSPAIGKAGPQTTTASGGLQTDVVPVQDAGFFTDGWGINDVQGDVVCIGANCGAMITHIDYGLNTLTLATNISFKSGDGVFLDGTQDIGAFNYSPAGYSYGITLTAPINGANVSGTTALTAAVTNPNVVRIVRFYVDGIEVGHAPPAPVVSVNAVISGTNNVVQARAYALYADTLLAATSSATINSAPLSSLTNRLSEFQGQRP